MHYLRFLTPVAPPSRLSGWGIYASPVILDIGTLVSPVWKKPAGVVGGQELSLDDIENVKLRAPTVRDRSLRYGRERRGGTRGQGIDSRSRSTRAMLRAI